MTPSGGPLSNNNRFLSAIGEKPRNLLVGTVYALLGRNVALQPIARVGNVGWMLTPYRPRRLVMALFGNVNLSTAVRTLLLLQFGNVCIGTNSAACIFGVNLMVVGELSISLSKLSVARVMPSPRGPLARPATLSARCEALLSVTKCGTPSLVTIGVVITIPSLPSLKLLVA